MTWLHTLGEFESVFLAKFYLNNQNYWVKDWVKRPCNYLLCNSILEEDCFAHLGPGSNP